MKSAYAARYSGSSEPGIYYLLYTLGRRGKHLMKSVPSVETSCTSKPNIIRYQRAHGRYCTRLRPVSSTREYSYESYTLATIEGFSSLYSIRSVSR